MKRFHDGTKLGWSLALALLLAPLSVAAQGGGQPAAQPPPQFFSAMRLPF